MSEGFSAGIAARTIDLGSIGGILAGRAGFAVSGPVAAPRHFHPADRDANPTAGWDMFATEIDPATVPADPPPIVVAAAAPGIDVEAIRATAYAEGFAQGEAAGRAAAADDADALAGLASAIGRLQPFDREALAARLNQTVLHLVQTIVGEVQVSPDRLLARVRAAAGMVADATQPAILRLNPDDLALVEGRVPDPLFAIADPGVARGGLVIETKDSVVEDGPATWLAALAGALERVAPPASPVPSVPMAVAA